MIVDNNNFYIKSRKNRKRKAYTYFGVEKKSYFGRLVSRIYDYYCLGATNLFREYKKYYRKEFDSFDSFLEKRYNLFPNEIEQVNSKQLMYKEIRDGSDSHIKTLIDEDEHFLKSLEEFLGGVYNEN